LLTKTIWELKILPRNYIIFLPATLYLLLLIAAAHQVTNHLLMKTHPPQRPVHQPMITAARMPESTRTHNAYSRYQPTHLNSNNMKETNITDGSHAMLDPIWFGAKHTTNPLRISPANTKQWPTPRAGIFK
jgi:hypothetical protein